MDIITIKTARENGLKYYYTGKPCKEGHLSKRYTSSSHCVICVENRWKETDKKAYAVKNKVRNEKRRDYIHKQNQRYYEENKEKININTRNYYYDNREKVLKTCAIWGKKNANKRNAYNAKRNAVKKQALPKWADLDKIKQVYINCPEGFHVDHIVPLQGKIVCGLHVENNLQYLSATDNISKGNKFDQELAKTT